MASLPSLTPQQVDKLLAFHQSSQLGTTTYLDPSDATHQSVIEIMLASAGRTKAAYPHLYNALYTTGPYKGTQAVDHVHLVDAGKTTSGKTTVTVWSSSGADTVIKSGHLLVFDADTKELLAQGENTSLKSSFLTCPARGATAKNVGKKLSILYVGHAAASNGTTRFFSFTKSLDVTDDSVIITVWAPVSTVNEDVNIAVGRTINNGIPQGTDYVYLESTPIDNPNLIVPFYGKAELNGSVMLSGINVQAFEVLIFVNDGGNSGSGQPISLNPTYTPPSKLSNGLSIYNDGTGPVPYALQFNYPYDQLGYQTTQSLVYNPESLVNEQVSYFYFAFNGIPYGDPNNPMYTSFWVCSKDSDEERSSNCQTIQNLYFWWHCLAKGTLVTLEDGSKKPIENINDTFRVATGGTTKKSLAVWATVQGRHSSGSTNEIYQLVTANGKSITATKNHMVFIAAGQCKPISHLVKGDPVVTESGISTVATVGPISYDGVFYNLALGSLAEKKDPSFPLNNAGFYAGGILCGDQDAMRHNLKTKNEDLSYILPHINPALRADYTAAVNDKRF